MKFLPQAANFIPISMFLIFGNEIPGVSIKYTNGLSDTRIFVSICLVIPGVFPTLKGFPSKRIVME